MHQPSVDQTVWLAPHLACQGLHWTAVTRDNLGRAARTRLRHRIRKASPAMSSETWRPAASRSTLIPPNVDVAPSFIV